MRELRFAFSEDFAPDKKLLTAALSHLQIDWNKYGKNKGRS